MLTSQKFDSTVSNTHRLIIPDAIAQPFFDGGHKRIKVTAFYNKKTIDFHAALQKRNGLFVIYFGKRHQKTLGLAKGDGFQLQFFEDTTKYGVEMPEEFMAVLESDPMAHEKFKELTDGKKRSLMYHIIRLKTSQTRIDKALIIAENLKRGITDQRTLVKP